MGGRGAADRRPPAPPAEVVVTPHLYAIEPEVARDFALLRVEEAVGRRSGPDIVAAVAWGEDRTEVAHRHETTRANVDQIVSRAHRRFRGGEP